MHTRCIGNVFSEPFLSSGHILLKICCLAANVSLSVSRSLPSNGYTCYNILVFRLSVSSGFTFTLPLSEGRAGEVWEASPLSGLFTFTFSLCVKGSTFLDLAGSSEKSNENFSRITIVRSENVTRNLKGKAIPVTGREGP
jgi:hypothetical protein